MLGPPLQPMEAVVLQHEQQRHHHWMLYPPLQPTATVVLWRVQPFLADVQQQQHRWKLRLLIETATVVLRRQRQHSWMLGLPLQPMEAVVLQHEQQRQHHWMLSSPLQPTATVVLRHAQHILAGVTQQHYPD
ncbi:uncharacterized protein LOC121602872 [Anopheles merus]|uniref:uncharacterized protein LOC121602872 n=1 Tax=Anopheles merus TaxID=30066 RepID=UPI001BE45B53|nr:uncharacterized protein LOC121602872 [Anopheles merus]